MGTRADFYVGRGVEAEWLGSIAFDGYPGGIPGLCMNYEGEECYRAAVELILTLDHATRPAQGWPWPWDDSRKTDYAYAFDGGIVWASCFGREWFIAKEDKPEQDGQAVVIFPNMSVRRNFTLGRRSGVIVVGVNGIEDEHA